MAKRVVLPWELKYDWAMKGWASNHRGFLYALREKYGAVAALDIFEDVQKGDRVKKLTDTIRTVFNIEGNDAVSIGQVLDLWDELTRTEYTTLERSPTINQRKVTHCPFKTGYEDLSDWSLIFFDLMGKVINPRAILERPKGMCAGDQYCEYVWKLDEITKQKETLKPRTKEEVIPWKLKYDFAFLKGWVTNHLGHLYAIRERYGSAAALEIYERFCRMGDRIKNIANSLKTIFKIEGNDVKAYGEVMDIWFELVGIEYTVSERSKSIERHLITKCPWMVKYEDMSDWDLKVFIHMFAKAINPKIIVEQLKNMCAGDSYCEFITKIEE